mmetsp:Transcript_56575/g.134773  ORF Transcript_56575/g.134773 Transcript_56575/m.134773 type:complete len:260 (+) Transcript_56575:1227-2006(+)
MDEVGVVCSGELLLLLLELDVEDEVELLVLLPVVLVASVTVALLEIDALLLLELEVEDEVELLVLLPEKLEVEDEVELLVLLPVVLVVSVTVALLEMEAVLLLELEVEDEVELLVLLPEELEVEDEVELLVLLPEELEVEDEVELVMQLSSTKMFGPKASVVCTWPARASVSMTTPSMSQTLHLVSKPPFTLCTCTGFEPLDVATPMVRCASSPKMLLLLRSKVLSQSLTSSVSGHAKTISMGSMQGSEIKEAVQVSPH